MKEIYVNVCGDAWLNPQQVQDQLLNSDLDEFVHLNINTEGPSLTALGITQALSQCCNKTGRDPKTIVLENWHNTIEPVEFRRRHCPRISHFFWMSNSYQSDPLPSTHQYLVGLFVGRVTLSRAVMLYDVVNTLGNQALLSLMTNHGFHLNQDHRLDNDFVQTAEFKSWWNHQSITSLDNHAVQDQYNPMYNTNRDLLKFYHLFDIEIVAETYVRGMTFFPTEKTVRPLSQNKALLVYGPRGYLAHLRNLGFETWHTVWDEDYDLLEGAQRWAMMRQLLLGIDQTKIQSQLTQIAQHNQQVLQDLIKRHRPQ